MSSIAWPAPTSCAAVASAPNSKARPTSAACRLAGCADVEQLSRRVDGLVAVAGGGVADAAVVGEQHQPGEVGVDGARHRGRQRDRGDQFTGRQRGATGRRQPSKTGATAMDSATGPGTHQRPSRLECDHQVHRVGVDAVELLRHRERGDAQVGQRRPDLAAGCGVARGPGAHRAGHVGGAERGVDTGGEVALLFVECEFHLVFPALSLGRPSSRSAMMLR